MKQLNILIFLVLWQVNAVLGQNTNYGLGSGIGGSFSSHFGAFAGLNNRASGNTFLGAYSGLKNTTGYNNSFVGYTSGYNNTTGYNNSFVGYTSGYYNTTGYSNIFLGNESGYSNTVGSENTFLGIKSGYSNTSGTRNVFMGHSTGNNNTGGLSNTFLGAFSGYENTTGSVNTFVGAGAGWINNVGWYNTFVGSGAGSFSTSGDRNTYLGAGAGRGSNGSGNVFIGFDVGYDFGTSNLLAIDNSDTSTPLIFGNFASNVVGINTAQTSDAGINYTLSVNGKIRATEVRVYTGWADYVFEPDYKLRPLAEVEQLINQNQHLPDVPSAKEVEKNGIFVGEMSKIQMQKIEELTLYVLEINKRLNQLEQENIDLKKQLKKMRK
jgi:trimeric autotransporter adhesin